MGRQSHTCRATDRRPCGSPDDDAGDFASRTTDPADLGADRSTGARAGQPTACTTGASCCIGNHAGTGDLHDF
ncbi:hypothetical protein ADT26_04235 [Xanthomonas oryzae]|nr:hypothetical protein AXO1947_05815 [Xanthomonas oryzae pv. oryzae]KOR47340.1 hypothetical protein ADT26_04235 [Xanthomonas oryzae]AUI91318.1 hypothetical protein BVV16_16005 [Xanthomonas oryzae pv. oryzae]AUI94990.1 hypothetical protein BVV17_16015 [Xanthomonas oryzae pv. oryzae]AUI98664.1 hypothetical protein BVV18_16020 [Xanthomonas oryzae pv. oryzae]